MGSVASDGQDFNTCGIPSLIQRRSKLGVALVSHNAPIEGRLCRLRPYRTQDALAICSLADDFMVSRWMTQSFPYPYTRRDADEWIELTTNDSREGHFAIEVDGLLAGGVGYDPRYGEHAGTATFGYWLGRAYWGRGIGTDAARALSDYALTIGGLRRLEASVFAQNVASVNVLEKCGFRLEGVLPRLYVDREGAVCDAMLFGRLAEPPE